MTAETVLVMPFIMVALMLIVYLGWNFRRLAQITNMDRYSVWEATTPGSPGPDAQGLIQQDRNPRLNNAFYGLNSDQAVRLNELRDGHVYTPQGHEDLRDRQSDETYAYFEAFLETNPRALRQRFSATHTHDVNVDLLGLSDLTRNSHGHSRMNGEWRYVNGIRYNGSKGKWEPGSRRVSPGAALRDVFFAELDEGLEPYDNDSDNNLAGAIRDFYFSYPGYRGPEVGSSGEYRRGWGWDSSGPGGIR